MVAMYLVCFGGSLGGPLGDCKHKLIKGFTGHPLWIIHYKELTFGKVGERRKDVR